MPSANAKVEGQWMAMVTLRRPVSRVMFNDMVMHPNPVFLLVAAVSPPSLSR